MNAYVLLFQKNFLYNHDLSGAQKMVFLYGVACEREVTKTFKWK